MSGVRLEAHEWLSDMGLDVQDMMEGTFNRVDASNPLKEFRIRGSFIKQYGFAVPTIEALDAIGALEPLVEVGAGCGYWAWELQNRGVDIVPTDPGTGEYGFGGGEKRRWEEPFTNVLELDGVTAVEKHPNRTLLVIWPDYGTSWPADTLDAYTGDTVAYIGESRGGCTADAQFHRILNERFNLERTVNLPHFDGIHDNLTIHQRTEASDA